MTRHLWFEIISWCTAIAFALSLLLAIVGAAAGAASGQTVPEVSPQSAPESQNLSELPAQPKPAQLKEAQMNVDAEENDYEGMITDVHCGAKHPAALDQSASDCVRICVHNGSAFALVVGDKTYVLDGDPIQLKKSAGQRARIHGNRQGNKIKVSAIAAA